MRHPKAKRTISKEILERHYNDENLSVSKIARKLGVGHATVWNLMASYQIQRRQIRKNLNAQQVIAAYSKPKESLSSLAKKFGCTVWTIQYLLRKNGVRIREGWEVNFKHIKNNFSGNLIEKAYLIGFRLGDLNCARKSERIIQVKSNTTKKAQLDLMKSLFEKYGPCYLGEDKEGTFNFAAALNNSFEFLIPKEDRIEEWILQNDFAFWAFFAGYTDAEGCIKIYENRARFRISTYDKNILLQLRKKLTAMGINVRFCLNSQKQPGQNQDCWNISVNEKSGLLTVLNMLQPYIKHQNRLNDLLKAKQNLIERIGVLSEKILYNNRYCISKF